MSIRVYEDAQNLISHSSSPISLRNGLRRLADAYLMLLDELENTKRELSEVRDLGRMTDFQP